MAWLYGLTTMEEVKRMKKDGYEVHYKEKEVKEVIKDMAKLKASPGFKMVSVYVDCDVSDLLGGG